jgi:hypothetical protein
VKIQSVKFLSGTLCLKARCTGDRKSTLTHRVAALTRSSVPAPVPPPRSCACENSRRVCPLSVWPERRARNVQNAGWATHLKRTTTTADVEHNRTSLRFFSPKVYVTYQHFKTCEILKCSFIAPSFNPLTAVAGSRQDVVLHQTHNDARDIEGFLGTIQARFEGSYRGQRTGVWRSWVQKQRTGTTGEQQQLVP